MSERRHLSGGAQPGSVLKRGQGASVGDGDFETAPGTGAGARPISVRVVETGLEQAELVTFGVDQDMPGLLPCLADVGRARTELQKAFELGALIAVGGVDVDVRPGLDLERTPGRMLAA